MWGKFWFAPRFDRQFEWPLSFGRGQSALPLSRSQGCCWSIGHTAALETHSHFQTLCFQTYSGSLTRRYRNSHYASIGCWTKHQKFSWFTIQRDCNYSTLIIAHSNWPSIASNRWPKTSKIPLKTQFGSIPSTAGSDYCKSSCWA